MTAGRSHRQPVRIRRRGRHASPSQVERVALQAGKAAPAVAIAGALVAAPTVQHSLAASAKPLTATAQGQAVGSKGLTNQTATLDAYVRHRATVTPAITTAKRTTTAKHTTTAGSTYYTVHSGDSLSTIAERYYHNPSDWQYLYHANTGKVSNPNEIYAGEKILVPASVPAHYAPAAYVPKHARTEARVTGHGSSAARRGTVVTQSAAQGMYSCAGLEELWQQAGGAPADAFMAAEIAEAESGGNPNAISPTADYGLWQINASNGSLATLNPFQNARSAIILSHDGTDWDPWTTYHSGAYNGKC